MAAAAAAEGVTFIKQKLPPYGQMPGVAFAASDVQAVSDGSRIVVFGGARNGPCNEMWQWTNGGEGWMQIFQAEGEEPAAERTQMSLTAISATQLVLFGGFILNIGCANDVERVTIEMDDNSMPIASWEKCSPAGTAPCARYGHTATLLSSQLVVFGGQDDKAQLDDIFVLSGLEGSMEWSQPKVSGSAPTPRMKHSASAVGPSQALVFGGFRASDRCLDDAYILDLEGGEARWEAISPAAPAGSKSIPPRSQHVACATGDGRYVYIYGGYDGDKNLNDLWLLDVRANALRPLGVSLPAPEARSRHIGHMIGSTMYVACGTDMMKPLPAEVYALDAEDPSAAASKASGAEGKKEEPKKEADDE